MRWPIATLCLFCFAHTAQAQSPYELEPAVDIPVLTVGATLGFSGLLGISEQPACIPHCDPSSINALDRTALGYHSQVAGDAANVALVALLLAPLALDAIDSKGKGWLEDAFVMLETVAVTQAVTQLTKFSVRRSAPLAYASPEVREASSEHDLARSFISGHASTAAAMTTSYTVTYWLRHPDDPARFVVLTVGAVLGLVPGVLKVAAGGHFWTDVAAGYAIGASFGVLVPVLHVTLECTGDD